jgi:hypothetical protein
MAKNIDLNSALNRLRMAVPEAVLPPDPAGLEQLQRKVPKLPLEVCQVYAQIGGMRWTSRLPLHMMPPLDVAATIQDFRRLHEREEDDWGTCLAPFGDGESGILLFSDDGSNYIGLHLRAPYATRGLILDHEEPSFAPQFRSLASVLNALANSVDKECYFGNMPTDYPVIDATLADDNDRALSLQLLADHHSDPDKNKAEAHAAMQLSHPDDMEIFAALLGSPDMWISERMCRIVGLRRYRPAINRMVEAAAIAGGNNRIIASIDALRDWPDDEAQDALRVLRSRVDKGYSGYFPQHLR